MKKVKFHQLLNVLLMATLSVLFAACGPTQPKVTDFEIHRGINIGCWLSQSRIMDQTREQIFTEQDIKFLAQSGFDHLRFPVDESQLFHEDMTLNEETVKLIHRTIKCCIQHKIRVIFDLHIIRSHHFLDDHAALWSNPAEQDKLVDMWRTIQSMLRDYPNEWVAYEVLNEAVAPNDKMWSDLMQRVLKMIRETEPSRVVVLGANQQNHAAHVRNIEVPEGDLNVMLSFHFYEPLLITHYQAAWTNLRNLNFQHPMHYPGKLISDEIYQELTDEEKQIIEPYNGTFDRDWILNYWKDAIDYAKSKGLKLYLGEFGCLRTCGDEVRLAWLRDVISVAKEQGIGYSLWEYNHGFGFADRWQKGVITDPELLRVITE